MEPTLQEMTDRELTRFETEIETIVVNDDFVLCDIEQPDSSLVLPEGYGTGVFLRILARGKNVNPEIQPGHTAIVFGEPARNQQEVQRLTWRVGSRIFIHKSLIAGSYLDKQEQN